MNILNSKNNISNSKGSLLFELLIVISLIAIILSVSANAMFLSMRSNKISGDRDVATALASESLEAMRSVVEEDWQNIYSKTKSSQHYYLTSTAPAGKWTLLPVSIPADEQVVLNGVTYTRYVIIDNVSRDSSTRNIQSSYSVSDDDPSTQKVTVNVSWTGGNPVSVSEYFFRWKNKICGQSGWSTGGTGNTVKNCGDTTYDTKDAEIDTTGGVLKLQ